MTHHTFPVFALVFLLFTCNVFFLPAKSAITPGDRAREPAARGERVAVGCGHRATAAGALGGGWLIDHAGWPTALFVNAATYLVSVIALLVIRFEPRTPAGTSAAAPMPRYWDEVREGWNVVRRNPAVGLALTALGAVWLAAASCTSRATCTSSARRARPAWSGSACSCARSASAPASAPGG
jgi:hypothetical protein